MEEARVASKNLSTDSSSAALSFNELHVHSEESHIQERDGPSQQQIPYSPEVLSETQSPVEGTEVASSEVQDVSVCGPPNGLLKNNDDTDGTFDGSISSGVSDGSAVPHGTDITEVLINDIRQQSEGDSSEGISDVLQVSKQSGDLSLNKSDIQNNGGKTSGEMKPDFDHKVKGGLPSESTELTEVSEDVNMERNLSGMDPGVTKANEMEDGNVQKISVDSEGTSKDTKHTNVNRGLIDTAVPFESVKEAVTKFGGIVDWKAHKSLIIERRNQVQQELEKTQKEIPEYKKRSEAAEIAKLQVLQELDSTKRLIEELKLSLEKLQMEEAQAKQDSELAQLRAKEMEQGITDEVSVAAKAQLEVAKARHAAAVAELKSVKEELEAVRVEYVTLVQERDIAIKKAEEAASTSKDTEKTVEDLTLELIAARESLESAHAAHLEAEEHRIGAALARDQDIFNWEKELKEAEENVQHLNEKLMQARDLKSKLDTASDLLLSLKDELTAYMEAKLNQEPEIIGERDLNDGTGETKETHTSVQAAIASAKEELEEVNSNIQKAKDEVNCLRVAAASLKSEVDKERAALAPMKQREGMASIAVSSLEAELEKIKSEIELTQSKEKEAREQMVELPKALQQAAQEADEAKSVAQLAQDELRRAKEEAELAKASLSTMEIRLRAALKEIEAVKASERLALAAVEALQESEQAANMGYDESLGGVTLQLEEYFILSKRAHEAEESAGERVATAIPQVEAAKESELRSLEILDAASAELMESREALRVANEKAKKAQEGKLAVEQELRAWRAEHEQRRKTGDTVQSAAYPPRSPPRSSVELREPKSSDQEQEGAALVQSAPASKISTPDNDTGSAPSELKTRKKKSLFPRIVMFLARKKSHPPLK